MAAHPRKQLSLDTNVLFELADGGEIATDFRETFQARGYALLATPRVLGELDVIGTRGLRPDARLARIAMDRLRQWDITPLVIPDVSRIIAQRFAERLIRGGLLPTNELSDGRILGETAVAGIPALVTFDAHLLGIDEQALRLALDEADLPTVSVAHPARLLRALR